MTKAPAAQLLMILVATGAVITGLTGCGQIPDQARDSGGTPVVPAEAGAQCEYTKTGTASRPVELPPTTGVTMSGQAKAVMTTSAGKITLTLDRDNAPCTVNSFISLAQQKFYDDTVCPRLSVPVPDVNGLAMLQCGDPAGDTTGGPGYSFPDELSGDETYPAGTLAMANSGPNTNGSQFFLVYQESGLSPDYTVFGSVDEAGLSVLSDIAAAGTDNSRGEGDGAPLTEVRITSVTIQEG